MNPALATDTGQGLAVNVLRQNGFQVGRWVSLR